MKNLSERGKFEDQWQSMFEDAEVNPSTDLWTRIDADLANDKANQYRKRAIVYQWVAAASLFFAVGFAAISYFYAPGNNSEVAETHIKKSDNSIPQYSDNSDNVEDVSPEINSEGNDATEMPPDKINNNEKVIAIAKDEKKESNPSILIPQVNQLPSSNFNEMEETIEQNVLIAQHDINYQDKLPIVKLNGVHRPMFKHIDKRPTLKDIGLIPKKENLQDNFYAGVNFSSGVFNPGVSGSSVAYTSASLVTDNFTRDASKVIPADEATYRTMSAENANFSASGEEESIIPGFSYTAGINTGFRLGKKWSLETGIAYVNNTNFSETSTILETRDEGLIPITMANFADQTKNLGRVKNSYTDIQLQNSYEFVSIPVKAAYWLLQSDFSLAVSAGVSTNLFVQNNVLNNSGNYENITVKPGEQSPYRNVYFNGILGSQVTYQFKGVPYSLMLEPSFLLALNNMTKDDYYFNSRPRSFMIGVGLRYHFD
ncbi:MAG: hypothetical protein ACOCWM_00095 [Cyclobacteriaceae bacterium]